MSEDNERSVHGQHATHTRADLLTYGAAVILAASACCAAALADEAQTVGYRDHTLILPARDPCSGTLEVNHDDSFENGYCFEGSAASPEPYGSWGEAYDLGQCCEVICGSYWVTTVPQYWLGQAANIYIWEGGVTGEPGGVLFVLPDVVFENVPRWPEVGQNDVAVGVIVSGEFTVGFWGNWEPYPWGGYFIAADEDGAGGRPWVYIAPGHGLPSGWQHPGVVPIFRDCRSLGIGLYYGESPTPVEAPSWGRVKRLFLK